MDTITIPVERFAELIECEVRLNMIKKAAIRERIYITLDDLYSMLGLECKQDEEEANVQVD